MKDLLLLLLLAICSCCCVTNGYVIPAPCGRPTPSDCLGCDLTRNPNRYFENTCTCGFYQCVPGQFGDFLIHDMPCPECECWDQKKLTCVYDPSKDTGNCPPVLQTEKIFSDGIVCTAYGEGYATTFEIVPGDPMSYYMHVAGTKVKMPCPSGTHFSVEKCLCDFGGNIAAVKPFMCLTFDESSPFDTLTGVYADAKNVEIVSNGGVVMNAARFNGVNSNIEIPAFSNREISEMSISLWYNRDASVPSAVEALVSNDDCLTCFENHNPSIQVLSTSADTLRGGYRTTIGVNQIDAFQNIQTNGAGSWNHVAMVYDGQKISIYVNGTLNGSVAASGFINAAHNPLVIGSMYGKGYFAGLMDQICFYDYALTPNQVDQLVANPGDVMFPG